MRREELLRKLKSYARAQGLLFTYDESRGKGSHGTIMLGAQRAICPKGETRTGTLHAILRQLRLTLEDLTRD